MRSLISYFPWCFCDDSSPAQDVTSRSWTLTGNINSAYEANPDATTKSTAAAPEIFTIVTEQPSGGGGGGDGVDEEAGENADSDSQSTPATSMDIDFCLSSFENERFSDMSETIFKRQTES